MPGRFAAALAAAGVFPGGSAQLACVMHSLLKVKNGEKSEKMGFIHFFPTFWKEKLCATLNALMCDVCAPWTMVRLFNALIKFNVF